VRRDFLGGKESAVRRRRRMLLGDDTGGGTGMVQPYDFLCVGVWITAELPCILSFIHSYPYVRVLIFDLPKI